VGRSNAAARAIIGGWSADGLVTLNSGYPLNITTGADNALSGTPNQRPNEIGNPNLPSNRARGQRILEWFNPAAFAYPTAGTYGDVGRNFLTGPGTAVTNFAFVRNFKLPGEGRRVQFRSEYFNLFNRVNLGNPSLTVSSGAHMGAITSAGEARVLQFALKVMF
jgi:hypothetical protein